MSLYLPVDKLSQMIELFTEVKGQQKKTGALHITLTGTNFDMDKFPPGKMSNGVNGRFKLRIVFIIMNTILCVSVSVD